MSYENGKYIPDPFRPRRGTQDRLSSKKLVAVRKHREFLEKLDDLTVAVFGEMKGEVYALET